jgi:hypothetical protein
VGEHSVVAGIVEGDDHTGKGLIGWGEGQAHVEGDVVAGALHSGYGEAGVGTGRRGSRGIPAVGDIHGSGGGHRKKEESEQEGLCVHQDNL